MLRLRKKQSHVDTIEAYACVCVCPMVSCTCECPCDPTFLLKEDHDSTWDSTYSQAVLNSTSQTRRYGG